MKMIGRELRGYKRMYKMKYIFGQTIKYKDERRKILSIRFTSKEILYKLTGIREWIKESEID